MQVGSFTFLFSFEDPRQCKAGHGAFCEAGAFEDLWVRGHGSRDSLAGGDQGLGL